jgi:ribosomal-protein-alanine N-acetyltransferase
MIIAKTDRLTLRPFRPDDVAAMHVVFGDPEVMRFGSGVKSPDWVAQWVVKQNANYDALGFGLWAVVVADGERVIGYCGLTPFPDIDGRPEVEVGYRLARDCWGQGFGLEAAQAVRDYAFGVLGLPRLIALIDPDNVASIRVAEKIGLRYEKDVLRAGYDHPDRVYAAANPGHKKSAGAAQKDT